MSKSRIHVVVVVRFVPVQQPVGSAVDCLLRLDRFLQARRIKRQPQRSIKAREACRVGAPVAEKDACNLSGARALFATNELHPSGPLRSNR